LRVNVVNLKNGGGLESGRKEIKLMNYKRRKPRRQVVCGLCTHRIGNSQADQKKKNKLQSRFTMGVQPTTLPDYEVARIMWGY